MKIEITLGQLNNVLTSLNGLVKVPLPAKYAYRFGKTAKQLQEELATLRENRDNLIRQFGEPNQEKQNIEVPTEKMEAYIEQYNSLMGEKIEIEFEPMPLSLFGETNVTAADMAWLDEFFVDDLEESESKEETEPAMA